MMNWIFQLLSVAACACEDKVDFALSPCWQRFSALRARKQQLTATWMTAVGGCHD